MSNPIIRAYLVSEQLKPGMIVQVMTSQDHIQENSRTVTNGWGITAEERFCNKDYVLTKDVITCLQQRYDVPMKYFEETRGQSWIMSYKDFKMVLTETTEPCKIHQCIRIERNPETNETSCMHILLSKDENEVKRIKNLNESANKNKNVSYQTLTFELTKTKKEFKTKQ